MKTVINSIVMADLLISGHAWAEPGSQYNMSLQDKVVTGPKGSLKTWVGRQKSGAV